MKTQYWPSVNIHHLLPLGCLVFLVVTLFSSVLFGDRQFAYRDASQTYYPLYKRIQTEWDASRWPLWLTEVNGGMPLLGNPISAVLYPGKIVYALLPYAWAARIYIIMHVVISCGATFLLARHWGVSVTGSAIAGLSYAFSGPVLFQYCNVVFLVGASWLPAGLLAADRWLVVGKRTAPWELAVVLSLQVLGGDLESAYLLGVVSACFAIWLSSGRLGLKQLLLLVGLVVAYYLFQLYLASQMARSTQLIARGQVGPTSVLRWLSLFSTCAAWGLLLTLIVRARTRLARNLAGLAAAGGLAIALCAVQLGPTLEFSSLSVRAANVGILDIYPFSLNPIRIAEYLWPNVFGTLDRGNRLWFGALPPTRSQDFWVPSLYVGVLGSILACGSACVRRALPWRALATGMFVVGSLGSLGEYGSPLLWARHLPYLSGMLGPLDSPMSAGVRIDGCLRDGDGSPYWLLTAALPGFDGFRFPSKLLTMACLGVVMLAGLGWDEVALGNGRRIRRCAAGALLATFVLMGFVVGRGPLIERYLGERAGGLVSSMGPFDLPGALGDLHASLWHAVVALSITLLILRVAQRRPRTAGTLALLFTTLDLYAANSRIVWTIPQAVFDQPSRLAKRIKAAELEKPSQGPFRIHRMQLWQPVAWTHSGSSHRLEETVSWSRDTLEPLSAVPAGIHYTYTWTSTELFDYSLLFDPVPGVAVARHSRILNVRVGERLLAYPRASYDLWNTRYFIIPGRLFAGDMQRDGSSFLADTERLYPAPEFFRDAGSTQSRQDWLDREDVQLLRNNIAFPRAGSCTAPDS